MNNPTHAQSCAQSQPFSGDIEKIIRGGVTVSYHYGSGDGRREVPTCEMDLFEFFYLALERFQKLVDMMGAQAHEECGMLFEALIRDVQYQLESAEQNVTSRIGRINCVLVDRGMMIPRPQVGRVIDAELTFAPGYLAGRKEVDRG